MGHSPWRGPRPRQGELFPGDFHTQKITTDDGATIHLRSGSHGPAGVLLHGFGAHMAPVAAGLAPDPTVVVPDRRGMGLSAHPADGDDTCPQAADVRTVRTPLGRERAVSVEHDLGPLVAYADAARSPDTTSSRRP